MPQQPANGFPRIKSEGLRQVQKLNHVDAALPGFDARNVRLCTAQFGRQLMLRQSRLLALFHNEIPHGLVARGT